MTVGIVGTGEMGRALARAVAAAGDPVVLTSGRRALAGRSGDRGWDRALLVLLALPFPAALDLMSGWAGQIGDGRTLVDVSNPAFTPVHPLPAGHSGGELIAAAARTWSVVKAFNTVPASLLETHQMHGRPVSVPVAGDPRGKAEVFALTRRLGFEPVDAGDIAASRELESLAVLLLRVSAAHGLHGRIAIHIGQPEERVPPVLARRAGAAIGAEPRPPWA